MTTEPIVGKQYLWRHPDGTTDRVIVTDKPLNLPEEIKQVDPESHRPQAFPGPALKCKVEVLPGRRPDFAKVSELFALDDQEA